MNTNAEKMKKLNALGKFLDHKGAAVFDMLYTLEEKIDFLHKTFIEKTSLIEKNISASEKGEKSNNYDIEFAEVLAKLDEPQEITVTLNII